MIKTIIQFGRALMTAAIIAASAQAESITYTAKTGSELKISGTSSCMIGKSKPGSSAAR